MLAVQDPVVPQSEASPHEALEEQGSNAKSVRTDGDPWDTVDNLRLRVGHLVAENLMYKRKSEILHDLITNPQHHLFVLRWRQAQAEMKLKCKEIAKLELPSPPKRFRSSFGFSKAR